MTSNIRDRLADSIDYVPEGMKNLNACIDCGLILTRDQWHEN